MPAVLRKYKVAFFPVPKNACSSFKHLFYAIEHKRPFQKSFANGIEHNVHTLYPSAAFTPQAYQAAAGCWKFAVVRDPVKRLLSAYSNRVLHYRELDPTAVPRSVIPDKMKELKLQANPDLATFIERLADYRLASGSIRHHTEPTAFFLGPTLSAFDAVFTMERLDDCMQALNARLPEPQALPHLQTGGPKLSVSDLSSAQVDSIRQFYAVDYALLSDFYV